MSSLSVMVKRFRVIFSGHVQGVGFRYTSKQVSRSFDVVGTVRNLANGTVELICECERPTAQEFIKEIGHSTHGRVADSTVEELDATGEFAGFEIVR